MVELRRGIFTALEQAVASTAVVVLEGGRAVGKSTLCRSLIASHGWAPLIDLSDPGISDLLKLDPLRFLRDLPTPAIIDEAQLVPELPLWVKRVVDERAGRPSQFILTGSARLGRHQLGGSDPLAGRSVRLRMWSLTPSERTGQLTHLSSDLFTVAFGEELFENPGAATEWNVQPWLRGGLPGIDGVLRFASDNNWNVAMGAYVDAVVPLGAGSARIDHSRLVRTLRYLAANPAQQLNLATMASELGFRAETTRNYIEALEDAFLLFRVEAHRPTEHKVLTAHPRIHVGDLGFSGWAGRLIDSSPMASVRGALLENQLAQTLLSTLDWSANGTVLRHWRDQRAKKEVDLLLVASNGMCVPIEVKSSLSVGPADTAGLQAFIESNRDQFLRGFVAYCGTGTFDLTPKGLPPRSIIAVPMSRLLN